MCNEINNESSSTQLTSTIKSRQLNHSNWSKWISLHLLQGILNIYSQKSDCSCEVCNKSSLTGQIDQSQDDEINVDLRTSGFDNEALSVECYAICELESFTHKRRIIQSCLARYDHSGKIMHQVLKVAVYYVSFRENNGNAFRCFVFILMLICVCFQRDSN